MIGAVLPMTIGPVSARNAVLRWHRNLPWDTIRSLMFRLCRCHPPVPFPAPVSALASAQRRLRPPLSRYRRRRYRAISVAKAAAAVKDMGVPIYAKRVAATSKADTKKVVYTYPAGAASGR